MQATNIHIIRESVVLLLRNSGYNVIEAADLWDKVYSAQYANAKPGRTYTWLIGGFEFIFTKQGEPQIVEHIEPVPSKGVPGWLIGIGLIALIGIGLVVLFAN